MAKYLQGKYKLKTPEKYGGNPTTVVFRSSYELRFMNWCESTPAVVKWSSEETVIPYVCPTDGRAHRYFVDFKIQIRGKDGELKTYLVEIKPAGQCVAPKMKSRNTKRFLVESGTFLKNQAKWEAAGRFARDRNWEFKILTEYDLGIKK